MVAYTAFSGRLSSSFAVWDTASESQSKSSKLNVDIAEEQTYHRLISTQLAETVLHSH